MTAAAGFLVAAAVFRDHFLVPCSMHEAAKCRFQLMRQFCIIAKLKVTGLTFFHRVKVGVLVLVCACGFFFLLSCQAFVSFSLYKYFIHIQL